ncbi:MAG TPA: hypothetical protein VGK47_13650, partial [Nitrososphaeraceae archaeon]
MGSTRIMVHLQEGIVHVFIFIAEEGSLRNTYFYIVILISLILPWYQISSNLLSGPLPIKFFCANIMGSSN